MNNLTDRDGFSLVEVIVAFAILALSLSILMKSFSLGAKNISASGRIEHAVDLAVSKLEEVGHTIELRQQEVTGAYTPLAFGWRLEINKFDVKELKALPVEETADADDDVFQVKISVHEESSGRLLFELESVKHAKAEAGG